MKVILFGASGTVGSFVEKALKENQHEVIGVSRHSAEFRADMQDLDSVRALYKKIGKFDAVACASGEVTFDSIEKVSTEQWENSFKSKVMGQINLVRAGLDLINDRGSFTLISGILADEVIQAGTVASTMNSAVEGFVRSVAAELPRGIRINCISPSVLTEAKSYHSAFPGFIPVDGKEVGQAYLRAISNPMTGRVLKLH